MSKPAARNPRHPMFKEEALKPGPVADREMVEAQIGMPVQDYPSSRDTTEAVTTILGWVLAMCVVAYLPNFFTRRASK